MDKNWKIYKSEEDWEEDGEKENSYILKKISFNIFCRKCGKKAVVYEAYEYAYGSWNVIVCNCGNEQRLGGCDG